MTDTITPVYGKTVRQLALSKARTSTRERLQPGTVFDNRFALTKPLASGGMSVVWLANDSQNNREVVLKLVSEASIPPHLKFLAQEAATFKKLAGSIIPNGSPFPIFYGTNATPHTAAENGYKYIAMEHIAGSDLRTILEDGINEKRRLPLHRAIEITLQLCGLEVLHKKNLVHGDIKPENIIIGPSRGATIIDFGLAQTIYTSSGNIVGSPAYMAPEQCEMRPLTNRTDMYALGIILYEMVTSHNPMQGKSNSESMTNQREKVLADLTPSHFKGRFPNINAQGIRGKLQGYLNLVIGKMTAKDGDYRFADLEAVRECLKLAHENALKIAQYETLEKGGTA